MSQSSNILDIPRQPGAADQLGVDDYIQALVNFITLADMPTTIAVQGEWGSGKTSLLHQIKHKLCETGTDKVKDAQLEYYGIWVNTWQYALLKTKSETIMSILSGLTKEITGVIKSKHESQTDAVIKKVGSIFSKLAKVGAEAALSQVGVEASLDSFMNDDSSGSVYLLDFKKSLEEAIAKCLELDRAKGNNNKGFIFFIDDLDRIDPPMAVEILELIKNIFEVDKCIFILAIDYEVVVKGLIPKFGPLTAKNEREFRSFFDKIIQLPFSMPIAMYDVNNFLIGSLDKINYLSADTLKDEVLTGNLATFASLSVGNNPRSLKRLINNISLYLISLY
jgi:predicted KAP-like P-loop ATPase